MKPIFKLLLLFCLTQGLFSASYAVSYYLSTASGDDSRSTTQAQNVATPWRSIDKLNSILRSLRPGDIIHFRRGEEFFGTINLNSSGSESNPIKFSAYGIGNAPIITSLVRVQGWRSLGNGIFESNQTFDMTELELILIDGQQQERGRYPNRDQFNGGFLNIVSSNGNSSVTSNQLAGAPNFSGGEVVVRKNHWIIDRHPVSNHSGNTISFTGISSYNTSNNFGFFVQNHINTLDRFGEWVYNGGNKKLYVFMGSNSPDNFNIQIPTRDNLFVKSYGARNFQIENLNFKGSNNDAISLAGGRNITLLNNKIEFSGQNGILSKSVVDLKIIGCEINYSNNNGIFLRYENIGVQILNNKITNTATFQGTMANGDGAGIGIFVISDNSKVEYNEIINTGYSGIYFGGNSTEVSYNFIDNFCLNKGDGGGIYSYGAVSASRGREKKVSNNIILNGAPGLAGVNSTAAKPIGHAHGIFLDDNVTNTIVNNNTIATIHDSGIKLANVRNLKIENNTIYDSDKAFAIGNSNTGGDVRDLTIQKNIIFPKNQDQLAYNFLSDKNDIAQIGNLNENYFFKPFGDPFHIFVRYSNGSTLVESTFDLGRWRQTFNKDQVSKETRVSFEKFKVNNSIGDNLFKNGNFTSNVVGVNCNNCQASWVSGLLSQGSLRVQSPASSTVVIPIGAVKKDGNYVAKIRGRGNKNGTIRVFLRHSGSPWQVVSPSTAIQLNANNQEYSLLLKPYGNIGNAALIIVTEESNFNYWLEDIDIRESNITETKPDDRILFEYNKSKSEKRITLDGTYIDGKGQNFSGSVTIPSFQSLVLFKTSSDITRESISAPTISITSPTTSTSLENGQNLTITTSVNPNGNNIKEVVFYNGDQIIGRSTNSPYTLLWNNPQPGDLRLKASVYLPSDLSYDSDIINAMLTIIVKNNPVDVGTNPPPPIIVDDSSGNSRVVYQINTGSTRDGRYQSSNFVSEFKDRLFENGNIESYSSTGVDPMLLSQRFGRLVRYQIPIENGTYTVKTYHNEAFFGKKTESNGPNLRVFSINIEGRIVKSNMDLFEESKDSPLELTFNEIVVTDGILNLHLSASVGDAAISGFSIHSNSGNSNEVGSGIESKFPQNGVYINAGGTTNSSFFGREFVNDFQNRMFIGGNIERNNSASSHELLKSQRFGSSIRYNIPVTNGLYTVVSYHNEVFFGNGNAPNRPGLRVFNISIEGRTVKSNIDMHLENNGKPIEFIHENILVNDGILNYTMNSVVGQAAISGLAVFPSSANTSQSYANLRQTIENRNLKSTINFDIPTDSNGIVLYPNPARDEINIKIGRESEGVTLYIHNAMGQNMLTQEISEDISNNGDIKIPLIGYSPGIYILSIHELNGRFENKKFIIK